ncbi:16S rRNA (adenine(1518)-N(6)/adenine(1519)-N(6))-dimethyltransferase RsmA [Lacticaseibacillus mingshuiensis]|uniref:16S rRNA (adenine(1518)-N(6)/adenine(1519)-N(6))- dimethyltransferase RsmA n=1 Tax=Lacticaseibacillus mingshuiensis TaxID=2799574 RepID=UPI0019527075|nr:16S rRNA (adenine(1518)-N(6)/adenine(1519)-N(6))-dimethyltransferase RsmA [Lacticaseibacillus mingshuiensis]
MTDVLPIAAPERTRAILKAHGFRLKKRLGQNFLTVPKVLARIVTAAQLTEADDVIEIGPGIGALTEFLAGSAGRVLAIEIDPQLLPVLADTMAPYDNVQVVEGDVLKLDLPALVEEKLPGSTRLKVVANLPYYITTPILMHLLQSDLPLAGLTVMMQKEVADRLTARPSTKDYGSLSIAVQQNMHVAVAFDVSRKSFVPAPNVDSAIVTLTRRAQPLAEVTDQESFDKLVRGGFAARRKTLWNNLINLYGKTDAVKEKISLALQDCNIEASTRAETLDIPAFAALSNALFARDVR